MEAPAESLSHKARCRRGLGRWNGGTGADISYLRHQAFELGESCRLAGWLTGRQGPQVKMGDRRDDGQHLGLF